MKGQDADPYTALALVYDQAMSHVDYEGWARYLNDLIRAYGSSDADLIELGCGTGSLTFHLARLVGRRYLATDRSVQMLDVAKRKLLALPNVEVTIADFTSLGMRGAFEVAVLAYDGINYALDLDTVRKVLEETALALRPGGVFLFDQTTPANSINNLSYFADRFVGEHYSYSRRSDYDEEARLHTTIFTIETAGRAMTEHHKQRAFTRIEMLEAIGESGFEIAACLEAFEYEEADDETERIQWVIRRPVSDR